MTPDQVALVEATVRAVGPRLPEVAAGFYDRLLAGAPRLGRLFGDDPAGQRRAFATELEAICLAVRDHGAFVARVTALGARHRERGVRAADYAAAGPALLGALAEALGPSWTPATAEAWRLAYHLTAEAMAAHPARRP